MYDLMSRRERGRYYHHLGNYMLIVKRYNERYSGLGDGTEVVFPKWKS